LTVFFFLVIHSNAVYSSSRDVQNSHAAILRESNRSITLNFDLRDVTLEQTIRNGSHQSSFSVAGEGHTYQYGYPQLPAVTRFVVVPPNAGLSFSYRADEPRVEEAKDLPEICTEDQRFIPEGDILYSFEEVYPPEIAEMSEPIVIRGVRMVKVTTYPVRYDPVANTYLHYDNIETEILFTGNEAINPVYNSYRADRSAEFLKFIRGFAINGNNIGRDDPDVYREPEYVGHYLIVIHENCLEYVVPFIEWRRKSGWKVDILSVENRPARDSEIVKGLIQERYDEYLEAGIDPFDQILLVGDHSAYLRAPEAQWVLESDRGDPDRNFAHHNDWYYACLEGDDEAADVGVSRWIAGSPEMMQLFVHRTLAYEMEPFIENPEWFSRGVIYAQHWGDEYHTSLATNVLYGSSVLDSKGFDDIRIYNSMFDRDIQGWGIGTFLSNQFNDGVNVMLGRAQNNYYRDNFQDVNANVIFPIDLNIAGYHHWPCWTMLRDSDLESPKGPCAATTGFGDQPVLPYNIVWLETVNGFMQRDLTYGWSRLQGLLAPEGYIPGFGDTYGSMRTDVVFYGDPGLQYWKGVPQIVEAEFADSIRTIDRIYEVHVFDSETGEDVPNAQVTLYVPGEMPEPGQPEYANYDEMFMITRQTDAEGIAHFLIHEDVELQPGLMQITVSGREILPLFNDIPIVEPVFGVELTNWTLDEIEGNGDENINQGESFELNLAVHNFGEDDLRNLTATVTTTSPFVEIGEGNVIDIGVVEADAVVESEEGVEIHFSIDCPDAVARPIDQPILNILLTGGETELETIIHLDPVAANFGVESVVGGAIIGDEDDNLNVVLLNNGRLPLPMSVVTLVSQSENVRIVEDEAVVPPLEPGDSSELIGQGFALALIDHAIPGTMVDLMLEFSPEIGTIENAHFQVQLGELRADAPQAADAYGYICYDDTDVEWEKAPVYDWVEICGRVVRSEFNGIEMEFTGESEHNIGEAIVLDLPFEIQFYGHVYDQVTVSSNGFISMGAQEIVINFQNWPMDRCVGGGVGMLAPFWDDLFKDESGNVYYYYDEESSRFIIEWYRFHHRHNAEGYLTFQVILQNRDVWVTESGDQDILFQYKHISDNEGREGWENSSPYASIGISSPEGTTGINYLYNNTRAASSAPLENGRAILFSTEFNRRNAMLYGRITDAATGEPIPAARIRTQHGLQTQSNRDGNWRIENALAEVEFDIYCTAPGYNDSNLIDLNVEEDGELEINFNLLHPEFLPSIVEVVEELDEDEIVSHELIVENPGNGPLNWEVEKLWKGENNFEEWELRRQIPAGRILDEPRVYGAVYADGRFFVAGSNNGDPMIYVLNKDGEPINAFFQFDPDEEQGYRDLAFDGEWIWASAGREIHAFTPEGEIMMAFEGPLPSNRCLAWDSDRELLWVTSASRTVIVAIDRDGNEVHRIDGMRIRFNAIAYCPEEPDGYTLLISSWDNREPGQIIYKMNPENNDILLARRLHPPTELSTYGIFCTNQYDPSSWILLISGSNRHTDRIDIWQIGNCLDWLRIEPVLGVIDAGESQEFNLMLNAADIPSDMLFEANLRFSHNAAGGVFDIPVTMTVDGNLEMNQYDMEPGWNLFSTNLAPINTEVPYIVRRLVEENNLMILKNGAGQFYSPRQDFCNIEGWNVEEGYQMKLASASSLLVYGEQVTVDQPILLQEGWNMAAYFPRHGALPEFSLQGIANDLILAKDGAGRFYHPESGYCNMRSLEVGQGYQFNMRRESELVYRTEDGDGLIEGEVSCPEYFGVLSPTGTDMSILLQCNPKMSGQEIGVFTNDGLLVGSGRINRDGYCGIAVWGDDVLTDVIDGAIDGEPLSFIIRDGVQEKPVALVSAAGKSVWSDGGFLMGEISSEASLPVIFGINETYPNPTNGPVRLSFGLETDAVVSLRVYDLSGRLITTLAQGEFITGNHQLVWETDVISSGLYLVKLDVPGRGQIVKVAVLK